VVSDDLERPRKMSFSVANNDRKRLICCIYYIVRRQTARHFGKTQTDGTDYINR